MPAERSFSHAQEQDSSAAETLSSTQNLDFMKVLNTAIDLGLPSIELRVADIAQSESERQAIVLGSGMTSNVVQYAMMEDDPIEQLAGQVVALKTFTRQSSATKGARQAIYEAIMREIEILCHPLIAGHPSIVQLHFIGWRAGEIFPALAMEHGAHGSLDYLIRNSWPGLSRAQVESTCRHITVDIAMGLLAIHQAGYVHGDLKPENILVMSHGGEDRRVIAKLTDFGGSASSVSQGGGRPVHFSPLWCAPEVLNNDPDIDWERADVYAYGLALGSLWSSINDIGGFGAGRLEKPTSCFLTAYTQSTMPKRDEEDMQWYMKTNIDIDSSQSVALLLSEKLKVVLSDNNDLITELLGILRPSLSAYFWTRPTVLGLGHSLIGFGDHVGRDVRQEMMARPHLDREIRGRPNLGPFSWTRSQYYFSILVEQATLALDDRKPAERDMVSLDDLLEVLPEDYNPVQYIKNLANVAQQLAFGNNQGESAHEAESRWADKGRRATLSRYICLSSVAAAKSPSNQKTFEDMTFTSAMAGDGVTMCFAALMFINTPKEEQMPIRFFLAMLALSHSYHAAQLLHSRWPRHYEMVQKIIKAKPSAFEKAKTQISPDSSPYMLETLMTYRQEPVLKRPLTLKMALDLGIIAVVRQVVEGTVVPDDFEECTQGLLHGLSTLPESEAAPLVPQAFSIGANLSFMAPAGSAIAADDFFQLDTQNEKLLSPLAAAIRRGKPLLALEILALHTASGDEPIVDFDEALSFSCTYLQCEVVDALLYFYHNKPHLCNRAEKFRTSPESLLSELLLDITTPDRSPKSEVERRLLLGPHYTGAYEKMLRLLLERIADLSDGSMSTTMLVNYLRLDDLIAVRSLLEVLEKKGIGIIPFLANLDSIRKDPTEHEIRITALEVCLHSNAFQCFEYILQRYPSIALDAFSESGSTLLHETCHMEGGVAFVEALLRCGADATLKDQRGQTPLFRALAKGNVDAANAIARYCSTEELHTVLLSKRADGWSVCFQLLAECSVTLQAWTRTSKSFKWLAEHNGIHPFGPDGVPSWYPVVGQLRPYSGADQRLHAELVTLLLGTVEPHRRIGTERWENKTILHHAVWNGHLKVVEILLDKAIDPNIGVEYTGELPQDIPIHIFDPSKDRPTALDIVNLKLGGFTIPKEISEGGFIEVQKWTSDLEKIRDLLVERGATSKVFDGIKQVMMDHSEAKNSARFSSNAYFRHGQAMSGVWPKPVAEMTRMIEPKTTREDILADTEMRDEVFHNIIRSHLEKQEMASKKEKEQQVTPEGYLQSIRTAAKIRRHEWRLPPDWHCLSITEDDSELDGSRVMYMNRITGECTYTRPALYRGQHNGGGEVDDRKDGALDEEPVYAGSLNSPDLSALSLDEPDLPLHSQPASLESANQDLFTNLTKGCLVRLPRDFLHLTLEDGSNMLHIAAIGGEAEFLSKILDENLIPIDRENRDGCTPLHAAVEGGALEVLELFLAHGADPNRIFPQRGHRPLHHSLLKSDADMANMLINGGADVNATTREGYSPLHFCMGVGDKPELVDILLNAGADVNAKCREGSALKMAVSYGHQQTVEKLFQAGARVEDDEELLHAAARKGSLEIAQLLLDAGLDVNKRTESNWTPIIDAVVYEKFDMLRMLCGHGADISVLAEEFKFFVRRRDDGNLDRMAMHVGKGGADFSAERLNARLPDEERGWEVWEPVRITKAED
ncbi:hypothetical protein F4808DRAFT_461716 [Astrocystis sublimbata]|nr:hypothetical protein F4808DRAFT_461716 [Astrocystis sublimbata]